MKRIGITAAVAALLATIMLTGSVAAAPPLTGSGRSFLDSEVVLSARQADGQTIVELHSMRHLNGALTGSVDEYFRDVFHSNGGGNAKGHGTFTGTLDGCGATPLAIPFNVAAHVVDGQLTATFKSVDGAPATFLGKVSGALTDPYLSYEVTYKC